MRVEIFNEKEEEKEVLRYRLVKEEGNVFLALVDRDGEILNKGIVLCLKRDGSVKRCGSVNPNLGLLLDEDRKVVFR